MLFIGTSLTGDAALSVMNFYEDKQHVVAQFTPRGSGDNYDLGGGYNVVDSKGVTVCRGQVYARKEDKAVWLEIIAKGRKLYGQFRARVPSSLEVPKSQ